MNVLSITVTERGRHLAARLPFPTVHGNLGPTVRDRWADTDAFVCFCAVGAVVRVVAPLLADKHTDPAVVCVNESARWVVPVVGAHEGGGNDLARQVAALIDATPVITTASDVADLAELTSVALGYRYASTQSSVEVVVGIGASSGAPADEISDLLDATLASVGLARTSVAMVATIDLKASEPGIVALGLPLRTYSADELATVAVPTPSDVVERAVGTPSVAEAAALLAAGPDGELVVPKHVSAHATVAIATARRRTPRRHTPRGHLAIVGLGPGSPAQRTHAAETTIGGADVVIGYRPYVDACADLLTPRHEVVGLPIGDEVVRAKVALAEAASGRRVALVSSGDAGIYAMASITLELAAAAAYREVDVEVVPGVTAALAAASLLGAPLGHDHAVISLSDLLTPWSAIERRVRAAADADLVTVFYNPRSKGRDWQLASARQLLLERRPPDTPVGMVTDAFRPGQRVTITTLGDLDVDAVGMTTLVVVGASSTRVVGGRMVTPRGYEP